MERLGDGNAIYVSGTGKGNLIKENFMHDGDSDHWPASSVATTIRKKRSSKRT